MSTPSQLIELFVVLCAAHGHLFGVFRVKNKLAQAERKSGPVRPDTLPTGLLGTPFLVLQLVVNFLLPTVYVLTVASYGFRRPPWMNVFALPNDALGIRLEGVPKNCLRILASLAVVSVRSLGDKVFDHLSDQYHPIGRREKPRVIQTGPYAWVRHPLYSLAILQAILQSVTFWSYAPLYEAIAVAIVFSIKITIEEKAIRRDEGMREEYCAYMQKVPARLVPYIW